MPPWVDLPGARPSAIGHRVYTLRAEVSRNSALWPGTPTSRERCAGVRSTSYQPIAASALRTSSVNTYASRASAIASGSCARAARTEALNAR